MAAVGFSCDSGKASEKTKGRREGGAGERMYDTAEGVSLPPLSFTVYKSRGRTDTPGVWVLERDSLNAIYCHLSLPSYVACTQCFFFSHFFSPLATFFFLAS